MVHPEPLSSIFFLKTELSNNFYLCYICDGTGDTFSRAPLIWTLEGRNEVVINLKGDTIS
jgi:hypothetical protein